MRSRYISCFFQPRQPSLLFILGIYASMLLWGIPAKAQQHAQHYQKLFTLGVGWDIKATILMELAPGIGQEKIAIKSIRTCDFSSVTLTELCSVLDKQMLHYTILDRHTFLVAVHDFIRTAELHLQKYLPHSTQGQIDRIKLKLYQIKKDYPAILVPDTIKFSSMPGSNTLDEDEPQVENSSVSTLQSGQGGIPGNIIPSDTTFDYCTSISEVIARLKEYGGASKAGCLHLAEARAHDIASQEKHKMSTLNAYLKCDLWNEDETPRIKDHRARIQAFKQQLRKKVILVPLGIIGAIALLSPIFFFLRRKRKAVEFVFSDPISKDEVRPDEKEATPEENTPIALLPSQDLELKLSKLYSEALEKNTLEDMLKSYKSIDDDLQKGMYESMKTNVIDKLNYLKKRVLAQVNVLHKAKKIERLQYLIQEYPFAFFVKHVEDLLEQPQIEYRYARGLHPNGYFDHLSLTATHTPDSLFIVTINHKKPEEAKFTLYTDQSQIKYLIQKDSHTLALACESINTMDTNSNGVEVVSEGRLVRNQFKRYEVMEKVKFRWVVN